MGRYATKSQTGYALTVENGALTLTLGSEGKTAKVSLKEPFYPGCWYSVAATYNPESGRATREAGSTWVDSHFNGKIDSPKVWSRTLSRAQLDALATGKKPSKVGLVAAWDFADGIAPGGIPGDGVTDRGPHGLHGVCVNFPARGMTGWNWDGTEERFMHAPRQYGAIHFHEDDLEDCRWETDVGWTVPDAFERGVYGAASRARRV